MFQTFLLLSPPDSRRITSQCRRLVGTRARCKAIMGERYLSRAKFWKSATEPYPNVCACIGTEIGIFHGRHWWHAAGPARKQFSIVVPEIVEQLNSVFTERYSSIVIFHLYMIGRSGESAIPTIMFFCEEKEPRKMAKKTVDEGGLLVKLPGFRTGHLVRRPGVGILIQPAGGGKKVQRLNGPHPEFEVYFDPSHPVTAIGMPIFVKQADNVLRRATANAVFHGEIIVYLSVAHVFHSDTSSPPATPIASDNSFDLGSGTEDEIEDDCLAATSRASMSSLEESPNEQPESLPPDSTSSSPPPTGYSEGHSVSSDQSLPDVANLEHLGNMMKYSPDLDWAVIAILHSSVAAAVHELKPKMPSKIQKGKAAVESEVTKVVAHTSRGLITGRIFHDATYVRLPGSLTFQKVYQTILDSHLEWGDCGVAILDAVTEQPHGHVVMSSATKEVVYIVPATQVFEESGTQWSKNDPDLEGSCVYPTCCAIVTAILY